MLDNKQESSEQLLGVLAKLQKVAISFIMSVLPAICSSAWNNSAPTGWIFMRIDV
jgi:hypothetical protein